MKKVLKIILFVSFITACADFFPSNDTDAVNAGDGRGGGGQGQGLPDKPSLDQDACTYGELDSDDVRQNFVWQMTTKRICPKVLEFRYYVTLLRLSADQLCLGGLAAAQQHLQQTWPGAVSALEFLMANPYGPLHAESGQLGMEIYSWPNYNGFALNAEYLKAAAQGKGYSPRLAPSRKGMAAVETLIFNTQAILPPGANGKLRASEEAFNALPAVERQAARCTLLRAMLNDVGVHTEGLYREWSSTGGEFPRRALQEMKAGGTRMQLNEISDGLFYFEKLKDFKLGLPLGMNSRCRRGQDCAAKLEFLTSGQTLTALRANLESFRIGMLGGTELGFDDLLVKVGRGDLSQRFHSLLNDMDSTLLEIEEQGSIYEQASGIDKATCTASPDAPPLCRLLFLSRSVMELYKSDFMTALNLQPPKTEADND